MRRNAGRCGLSPCPHSLPFPRRRGSLCSSAASAREGSHPVGNGDGPGSPSLRICLDTRRVQRGPWAPMQAGMLILSRVEGGSAVLVPAFGHPEFNPSLKCFCSLLRTRALQPQSFPVRRSIVLHGKLVCFLARATVLACSQASKEFVYTSLHQPLKPIGNRSASSIGQTLADINPRRSSSLDQDT